MPEIHRQASSRRPRVSRPRPGVLAVLACIIALAPGVLAACTTSPEHAAPAGPPEQPADAEGLERAVAGYAEAIVAGDADRSHLYLSARCRETWPPDLWADWVSRLQEGFAVPADSHISQVRVTDVRTREVTSESAQATATFETTTGQRVGPDPEAAWGRWIHEDGGWRVADCPAPDGPTRLIGPEEPDGRQPDGEGPGTPPSPRLVP